jgi:phage replication-related protein YjqB (UPF0714/DUF867 family)
MYVCMYVCESMARYKAVHVRSLIFDKSAACHSIKKSKPTTVYLHTGIPTKKKQSEQGAAERLQASCILGHQSQTQDFVLLSLRLKQE